MRGRVIIILKTGSRLAYENAEAQETGGHLVVAVGGRRVARFPLHDVGRWYERPERDTRRPG